MVSCTLGLFFTNRQVGQFRNFQAPKIKVPCVTAQYYKLDEKHFHLDYPVFKKQYNNYFLAVGKEHSNDEQRKWEESDPKGLLEWLNNPINSTNEKEIAQYKRIVKYLKRWRDYKFPDSERKKFYSIGIGVMAGQAFNKCITPDGDISDIDSLLTTVESILSRYFRIISYDADNNPQYDINVILPKKPSRDIFSKHGKTVGTIIQKRLVNLKNKLEMVIQEVNVKKQCEILSRDVFGSDFPIPETGNNNKKFKESGYVSSPQGA